MSGAGGGGLFGENSPLFGPKQGSAGNSAGVGYTPTAAPNYYTPSYTPQTATPFLQSIMSQNSSSPLQRGNTLGLPSLQSMFNMPQNGLPLQTSGIQQLATMAPYISSAYRPNMSNAMNKLNFIAPSVTPEQVSALDNYGKPVPKPEPVAEVPEYTDSGG
jgi:hypothetical protein